MLRVCDNSGVRCAPQTGPKFNCWTHIAPSGMVLKVAGRFRDFCKFVRLPEAGRGGFVISGISCCRSYILYENEAGR